MAMMPLSHPDGRPGRPRRPGAGVDRPGSCSFPIGPASASPILSFEAEAFDAFLAEFTSRWQRGENPSLDDYLSRLNESRPERRVELIYRDYHLRESAGLGPLTDDYVARFPADAPGLSRLFAARDLFESSRLRLWSGPGSDGGNDPGLPEAGDEIGPYRLLREIGRGGFARVFLAGQADLDDRLVVVKVSTKVTTEPVLLARAGAGHPHIVEVFWHGLVDGGALQILCMPFLGGATLAAILAGRRRSGGARLSTGRELLGELDRVSAPEFPRPGDARPARQLLDGLSYPRSAAWVVARLAEALDFAFSRGVLHGDVKPSNVLLTSEGVPMLLDFNLAVGWRSRAGGLEEASDDLGGTLAYMAPERLMALADPLESPRASPADRHRADIYALGIVLLELLTGRPPELPGTANRAASLPELASAYIVSRKQGCGVMIRAAREPVSGGLRAILEHCLEPNPSHRYRRASELAEDLDLWRTYQPLSHASEPGHWHRLARWARRRHIAVAAAAAGLAISAAACAALWYATETTRIRRAAAVAGYSQIVDSRESGAFQLRRGNGNLVETIGDPAGIPRRHLERFGLLSAADWRKRDDFRGLPAFERAETEVWLMEQALRFARVLDQRLASHDDWRRALICLERADDGSSPPKLEEERRVLRKKLELPDPTALDQRNPPPSLPWTSDYLAGVEAELRFDMQDALHWYRAVLRQRPRSFWANYRAAVAAFALKKHSDAVGFLRVCVEQRPDSHILRHQFASCLFEHSSFSEAAGQYDKAAELDPDYAETYLSRSFLRVKLSQYDHVRGDIEHYELLKGRRKSPAPGPRPIDLTWASAGSLAGVPENHLDGSLAARLAPDEIGVRLDLATQLSQAGQYERALKEFESILASDPEQVRARYGRAVQFLHLNRERDVIDREFARVVEHPQVEQLVHWRPVTVYAFHRTANRQIDEGQFEDALRTARRGLSLSERYRPPPSDRDRENRGRSHCILAQACLAAAGNTPELRCEAREELELARSLAPAYVDGRLAKNELLRTLATEHAVNEVP